MFFVNMPGLLLWKTRNKIWVNKGSEFCIRSTKSWLQDIDNEIQHIMKENLLLLKNLLEFQRIKSTNI